MKEQILKDQLISIYRRFILTSHLILTVYNEETGEEEIQYEPATEHVGDVADFQYECIENFKKAENMPPN